MAGHSHWKQVKNQKGIADKKKSSLFGKLSRAITVAAREGTNLDFNVRLRLAIDQAREANMPKDNIERALAKASGEGGGAALEEITYEGFGPAGVAFLMVAVTDNRNRASSFLKSTFNKYGGSLGSTNSVQWMFQKKGFLRIPAGETNELAAIEAGAEDVVQDDGALTVITSASEFENVKKVLQEKHIAIEASEIRMDAKEKVSLDEEQKAKVQKVFEEIEENEDISEVYTNAEF